MLLQRACELKPSFDKYKHYLTDTCILIFEHDAQQYPALKTNL